MKGPLFYAKILLFGEYGIIKDSKGLAIPFNAYRGALKTSSDLIGKPKESNGNLEKFYKYLSSLNSETSISFTLIQVDISNSFIFFNKAILRSSCLMSLK